MSSPRRYYLLKRLFCRQQALEEEVWIAKQAEHPGTDLPASFPFHNQLSSAGYTTVEDLDGASPDELNEFVGLSRRDFDAVTAALAAM